MKTISVAELRQNPTAALQDVEHGESYVITRYRRAVARLVPAGGAARAVRGADVSAAMVRTPLVTDWAAELDADRHDDLGTDPWGEG